MVSSFHHVCRWARHVSREGLWNLHLRFLVKACFAGVVLLQDFHACGLFARGNTVVYSWRCCRSCCYCDSCECIRCSRCCVARSIRVMFALLRVVVVFGQEQFVFGWRTIESGRRWIRVSVEFHAEFQMFPTCVVSKMWKLVCEALKSAWCCDVSWWRGPKLMCCDCWLLIVVEVCESCDSSTEPKKACDPPFVNTRCFAVNFAEHVLSCNSVVLWLFGSWGIFSWFVVCSRSVNCCPDPCVVWSNLLMLWLVRRVSWMTFPSDTCFRVGGGFFAEGWRVSSVFTDVVSLSSLEKRKVHHSAWEICCPFCVFVCTTFCSMMRQMTSRTRCGSHSHPSCVTTIEAFVRETNACLDTFFSYEHVACREFTISCFLRYESVFFHRGQSDIISASDITE